MIKERKGIDVHVVTIGKYMNSKITKTSKVRRIKKAGQRGFQGLRQRDYDGF